MSSIKFDLNERGVAGIYLMAMALPAGQREMNVLADIVRLCFLSGVQAGLKNPTGDPIPIQDEITTLAELLQKTCIPHPEPIMHYVDELGGRATLVCIGVGGSKYSTPLPDEVVRGHEDGVLLVCQQCGRDVHVGFAVRFA